MADFNIVSPDFSFVGFSQTPVEDNCCDGDTQFCLPVIEETDCNFQFKITGTDIVKVDALMAVPIEELQLVLLNGFGNNDSTVAANFLRNWTVTDGLIFERYRTGILQITFVWRNAFKDIKTLVNCDDCFEIAVFKNLTMEVTPGSFGGDFGSDFDTGGIAVLFDFAFFSNCFKRKCNDCYTAVLEYYNDEDYAGFNYCNVGIAANRVRLPLYLTQPKTIEDKAVYRKSQGKIKQTRSLITKEYLVLTDHFPEQIHDKIAIALGHDEITIYSGKYNGGISKNGEYAIEWVDNLCKAPAQFKALATPFAVRNNNCSDCAEVDLLLTCATLNGLQTGAQTFGSNWQALITGCNYAASPVSGFNQTVEIYYRQKFSLGAYTLAGTVVFNALGSLISAPNPFAITGISDNWDSIEIKAVNLCGSADFISYVDNPCAKLSGLIANTIDDGTTWTLSVTDVVYSLWPLFGVHKMLSVYYREYGGGGAFVAAGVIDVVVAQGYVVTLSPNPFNISGINGAWERVEIKTEYGSETGCDRELIQIFSNPISGCAAVTAVSVDDVQADNVSLSWPRVLPTPAGLYDWELATDIGFTTIVQSGNAWNPGGSIMLLISGLNPLTHYYFRVRAVCSPGEFSSWALADFNTASPFNLIVSSGTSTFSVGSPSGNGSITGPVGALCTVNISALGLGTGWITAITITGATTTGSTTVTDASSTFTFIMPPAGSVLWSGAFTAPGGSSAGSGSISV